MTRRCLWQRGLLLAILAGLAPAAGGVYHTPGIDRSDRLIRTGAETSVLEILPQASLRPVAALKSAIGSARAAVAAQGGPGAAARQLFFGKLQPTKNPNPQPRSKDDMSAKQKDAAATATSTSAPDTIENEIKRDYGVDISNYTANVTHTWGNPKHNVMGLPSYAAVLVGGAVAALIVICTNSIGGRLAHPLPFFASDEQKMKDQIENAREKVRLLEAALEAKRLQEIKEAEEEARKAAGDPKLPDGPTHDELVGEMLYRTQEVQKGAVGAVNDSIKQAAPLLARASHVQNVFKESVSGVQDRVGDLAIREATTLYGRMKEAVGADDVPDITSVAAGLGGYELPNWFKIDDDNDLDPPPFALLLGGMFAPAQIQMTRGQCNTQIVWDSIMLATCTACFIMDAHHGCPDELVWAWIYGMLTLNMLDVMCCAFIASRCATAIGTLQDNEDTMGCIKKTGNVVWDSFIMLQANTGQFFKAYFAYQNIIDSWIYTFQKCMGFVSLFWGCLSMWVTIEDIVKDTLGCDAKIILWFMHAYSWFFLLFLTWTILGLVIWLIRKLSGLTVVSAPIILAAKDADAEVPFKLPLFQTIARSFLLRDSSTMLFIKAKQIEADVAALEKEIEDTKQKLANRKTYLASLDYRRSAAATHEKDLIEKYKEKVREEGGTLWGELPPGGGEGGSASSSGLVPTDLFADAPSAADLLQQVEATAASAHEQGWDATLAQSQAAAGAAASSAMQNEQVAGLVGQASDAAASAQAAASSAMDSPEAQGYMQQAQQAAASAQAAASSAQVAAMQNEQLAGMVSQAGEAAAAAQATASAAAASPEAQAYLQQAQDAATSAQATLPGSSQPADATVVPSASSTTEAAATEQGSTEAGSAEAAASSPTATAAAVSSPQAGDLGQAETRSSDAVASSDPASQQVPAASAPESQQVAAPQDSETTPLTSRRGSNPFDGDQDTF